MNHPDRPEGLLSLTADIVASHIANNKVPTSELPAIISSVYDALVTLGRTEPQRSPPVLTPAVAISRSVTPDYIVSLEDGRRLKTLKRHLMAAHGLTPEEYRRKWGLPDSYPMVAPNYSKARRQVALESGLGAAGRNNPKGASKPTKRKGSPKK